MYQIKLVDNTIYETDRFTLSNGIRVVKDTIGDFSSIESTLTKVNLKTIQYLDAEGNLIRTEIDKEYKGRMLREPLGEKWVTTYYLDDVDVIREELEELRVQVEQLISSQEA